jgi:hypothetical protein
MLQSSFINVPLARHVSGDLAHHQERRPVLHRVVLCTQICCVAVRLSRKIAAWSVWMVWRALTATPYTFALIMNWSRTENLIRKKNDDDDDDDNNKYAIWSIISFSVAKLYLQRDIISRSI